MSLKRESQVVKELQEPNKKPMLIPENTEKLFDPKNIPPEIWLQIFGFFSLKEIKLTVALVCKFFNEFSNYFVQRITLNKEFPFTNRRYKMFDAIHYFKNLKSITIEDSSEKMDVEYCLMNALNNCPRLKHVKIRHSCLLPNIVSCPLRGMNKIVLEIDSIEFSF